MSTSRLGSVQCEPTGYRRTQSSEKIVENQKAYLDRNRPTKQPPGFWSSDAFDVILSGGDDKDKKTNRQEKHQNWNEILSLLDAATELYTYQVVQFLDNVN